MQCSDTTRVLLALLSLLAASLAGCSPDLVYELTTPQPTVQLPRDEAPHDYGGEWWYYTGRLTTDDNRTFGVETVIFHRTLVPIDGFGGGHGAHYALLDEATGGLTYSQSTGLPTLDLGPPQTQGFDVQTPLIHMQGLSGQDHLQAAMCDGSLALDLAVTDERGPVLHGDAGYIPYGLTRHSFYYSRPRMKAAGTLQIGGQSRPVTGTLWFDRQWGYDVRNPWLKWDWFSIRLDDGSSIMLYIFRDKTAPVVIGTYVPATGDPIHLDADAFTVQSTDHWRSPHTGIRYPVSWNISIPSQGLALTVTAAARDQELDARLTTLNIYWEGLCTVTGTRTTADQPDNAQPVAGYAYTELTNYTLFD